MFFKLFFALGFLASLFVFFKLIKDDIKLISLRLKEETILDIFLLTCLASLFGARVLYVGTHFGDFGLNPFKIALFTHFPGLSFTGGVLGGTFFLFWFLKKKNILRARIFDLAALASQLLIILGFLGSREFIGAIVFILFSAFLIRMYSKAHLFGRLNFPGVLFLIFLAVVSISTFLLDFAKKERILAKLLLLTGEQIISIIVLIVAVYLLVRGFKKGYI